MLLNAMEIHLEPAFKNRTACRRQMPLNILRMKSNYIENAHNFTDAQCFNKRTVAIWLSSVIPYFSYFRLL